MFKFSKKFKNLNVADQENVTLKNAMRHYDHTVNVKWVMHHLNAAKKYLNSGEQSAEATGGNRRTGQHAGYRHVGQRHGFPPGQGQLF